MVQTLEDAIAFAALKHAGQKGQCGIHEPSRPSTNQHDPAIFLPPLEALWHRQLLPRLIPRRLQDVERERAVA